MDKNKLKGMYQKNSAGKWNPITRHSILRSNLRRIKIMNIFMK